MSFRSAFLFASAVLVTAGAAAPGVAYAQDSVAERNAIRAEVPWFERFTLNHGPNQTTTGPGQSDARGVQAWQPATRWGVTVNLREAERSVTAPVPGDETAVGAYYQFTPSVRVGGQVSVGRSEALTTTQQNRDEPEAGVRLESAFRF